MTDTYLGLDLSTQQLKAVVTSGDLSQVLHSCSVTFDKDLPEFNTQGGVHISEDGATVTSPVHMWIKAIDMLLKNMTEAGVDLSTIKAISGAGQQHGTVYWKLGAEKVLQNLAPEKDLYEQLKDQFVIENCPVWMDSSTKDQCQNLEKAVGGPEKLAKISGSRALERFSGNQIAKIYGKDPQKFKECERVSLVSSFIAGIFCGKYAPIDLSDGSGMNLLDISGKQWDQQCLDACAQGLGPKLGKPVPSNTLVGPISSYFATRYKFTAECKVVTFTGDNPSSLAGLNLAKGDIAISLGTSDTVFAWVTVAKPNTAYTILCNPIDHHQYMALLCFKNGALTRENIRKQCSSKTWLDFCTLLAETPPGNNGNIGFYFDLPEILPGVDAGYHRYNSEGVKVDKFEASVEARAVLEHQCLAKRIHAEQLGQDWKDGRVIVTGGASENAKILDMLADVFNADVYTTNVPNSAALGGAYRAKLCTNLDGVDPDSSWDKICKKTAQFKLRATPLAENVEVYDKLAERYKALEAQIV